MRTERVQALERKAGSRVKTAPTSKLQRWWRAYLDRSLTSDELVALADAVVAVSEGWDLSPTQEQAAADSWRKVWGRTMGDQDVVNLRTMFGEQQQGWRQVLAEPGGD